MPNVIKSATTVSNGTIKRNNFLIGVDTSLEYGPTDNGVVTPAIDVTSTRTFFWNGVTPPPSGYVVYVQKTSDGPSILVATGDTQLIQIAIQNGGTNINTATNALNYFNGQSNFLSSNLDYPSIVTTGLTLMIDAGFTPSYPRTGATWNDLSGNNNNGTLVASPTFSGANQGSLLFNGSSQYATLATPSLYTGNQLSITLWSRLTNPTTPPASSIIEGFDSSNNRVFNVHNPWNDNIVYWDCGNTTTTYDRINSAALTTAQKTGWHYYGFTKNATTGVMNIYLDGSLLATGTTKTKSLTTCTNIRIGSSPSNVNFYAGNIGNIQTYNRELSSTEILQNYNSQLSRYSSLLSWDFANTNSYPTTGSTVTDLSGNGNTGTLVASPTFNTANGGCIVLNGTTQYISAGSPSLLSSWTLEIWAYMNSDTQFGLFGQGTQVTNQGLHIYYTNGARGMVFGMYSNDNDYGNNYRPTTLKWYHWVFTYNSSTFAKQFYADGVLQTPSASVQNAYAGSGQFNVGANYSTPIQFANGRIGIVNRYSSVLSSTDVLENYNSALPRYS
jgi:hypothetical protein